MTTNGLPDTSRGRLRWALREGLIIAGIVLFWLGIAVALTGVLSLLGVVFHTIGFNTFRLLGDLLHRTDFLWPAFSAIAFATIGLYIVVRAGTVLIDHYLTAPH